MERPALVRFDGWVLQPDSGELTKGDLRIRLQDKPLQILIELLGQPGELVTREQLITRLWPKGVVDFDMALNAAMRRLRVALQDEAETPRYIETVPRRGYRFIGTLETAPEPPAPTPSPEVAPVPPPVRHTPAIPWYRSASTQAVIALLALIVTATILSTRHTLPATSSDAPARAPDDAARESMREDAAGLYERGKLLLANRTPSETDKAEAAFARATVLDPGFARGYSATGTALLQKVEMSNYTAVQFLPEACKAFDRALELDSTLGEAWTGRAFCTQDPVLAEVMYRQGIQFAPGEAYGYEHFAGFLFQNRRRGEAIEVVDRGLKSAPRSPGLLQAKAFFVMVMRNDLAEHNRLLREALAINPDFQPALMQLGEFAYYFRGEFADSARMLEHVLSREPHQDIARNLLAGIYLDMNDAEAAEDVLRDAGVAVQGRVALAQYRRDLHQAAEYARSAAGQWWFWSMHSNSALAEAIRDDAISTREFSAATRLLDTIQSQFTWPPGAYRGFTPVYAHTLVLANQVQRGRQVATSLLSLLDAESVGRPAHWFGRERAAALVVLGRPDEAIEELAGNQGLNHLTRWWYMAEADPLYAPLRSDPRFQQLAAHAKAHRAEQRTLLEALRQRGEVPRRDRKTSQMARAIDAARPT